jgi:hypothetical protein
MKRRKKEKGKNEEGKIIRNEGLKAKMVPTYMKGKCRLMFVGAEGGIIFGDRQYVL